VRRLCLLIALALACRRQPPPPRAGTPAVEVQAEGTVWHARSEEPRQPFSAGPLGVGEMLVTGPDGKATVRLAGGRQLELGANGRLHLGASLDGRLVVEVESGRVTSRTSAAAGQVELTILTPFGITRVPAQPGEVSVSVAPDGGRVAVTVGSITFVDKEGRQLTARADETIEVSVGRVVLVRPPSSQAPAAQPVDVMLSADEGPLLVRRPGEPRATRRRAVPAPAGTTFQVAPGGRARMMALGVRAHLGPGAAGQVGEASGGPGGLHLGLGLDRGSALVTFDGAGSDELLLGDPARPLRVRVDEPTTIAVTATRRGPRVSVLAGSAELVMGEEHERLDPSVLARFEGGQMRVQGRGQAEVILPTARGLRVYADHLEEVTLSWPLSMGAARVEVSADPEFKDLIAAGRTSGGSVTVPVPPRGDLHWRVIGPAERVMVGQARFAPDRRRSALDLERPRNLVSEVRPVTTVYFQSALPVLTFTFAPHPGAARHRLRVYREEQLGTPVVDRVVREIQCTLDATPLREGRYVWNVTAVAADGRELDGAGRLNKLELVYDNALTTLAIGSPRPGEAVSGSRVDATGVAPLGSKLFINGQAAPLDAKGRFAVSLERRPAVVFRLVGPDGAERYWVRKLRVRS
jgi:hypothetical protein